MAKGYVVNRAFQSPSLGVWITRDTAHMIPKMESSELTHAVKTHAVSEVDLPAGMATVEQAQQVEAETLEAKQEQARLAIQKSAATVNAKSEDAVEAATKAARRGGNS